MSEKIKKDRREFLAQAGALVAGSLVAGNAMAGIWHEPQEVKPITKTATKPVVSKAAVRQTSLIKNMIGKKALVLPHSSVTKLTSPFSNVVVDRSSIVAGGVEVLTDIRTLATEIKVEIDAGKYGVDAIAAVLEDIGAIMDGAVVNAGEGGGCGEGCDTGGGGGGCGGECGGTNGGGCGGDCGNDGGGETGTGCNDNGGTGCSGSGCEDQGFIL